MMDRLRAIFIRLGFQSINAHVIDEGIATLAGVMADMQKRCPPRQFD